MEIQNKTDRSPEARRKRKRRKKHQKAKTNFRPIRDRKRIEKNRLNRQVHLRRMSWIDHKKFLKRVAKKVKHQEVLEELKKGAAKRNSNYRATLNARGVRRTEVKIINSRRDKKKELELRTARQREKSRVRTENKRMRKVKAKEALAEKRKAS